MEAVEKSSFLNDRAVKAKYSRDETERLIEDFKPFLQSRVARYARGYDEHRREELFSIVLLAFYEAIQSYNSTKGHFFPFAKRVVNDRAIDYIRGIYRQEGRTIPLEDYSGDVPSSQTAAAEEIAMRAYETANRQQLLVDEIEQFKEELAVWGITMDSLSRSSPKHQKLREDCRMIVHRIHQTPDLVQTFQLKRYFPMKAIADMTGIPLRKLERTRTFVIASLIIKIGDYDFLAEYVKDHGS